MSVPRIATLATAAVTRVNHVLETASSPDFFSSLLEPSALVWRQQLNRGVFFAAHLPAHSEEQIVLGGEGQGWLLMEPNTYVSHPEAIPHFAQMVKAYRDQAFG